MTPADAGDTPYRIRLSTRGLPRLLWVIVALLVAVHLALRSLQHSGVEIPWDLHLVFDVDGEPTVPTWYSSTALFFAALLGFVIARARRRTGDRDARAWHLFAALVLLLSLDEIAAFHEMANTYMDVEWTIPAALLLVLVAAVFGPFLMRLGAPTRTRLVVAGLVFVAGAVVVEHFSGPPYFRYDIDTIQYAWMTALEEGLEMSGGVLLIRALQLEIERGREVDIGVEVSR